MAAADRPNILLILADQHRWDCLGCYGNRQIRTPHLDALAADAVRYDESYCVYPVCTPSRYSLLSGLHVRQHGGGSNHCTLAPGIATFPRALAAAGYRTAAVGKHHFTPTYLDVGYQSLTLSEQDGDGRLDDDYHRALRDHGLVDALDLIDQRREFRRRAADEYWQTCGALTSDLPEEWHSTTWTAERALEELETWDGGGHQLTVGFIKPHHPFDPPRPWDTMYAPDDIELLPGWLEATPDHDHDHHPGYFPNRDLTEAQVKRVTAFYYATISQIDHHVGRMIEALRRRGQYDNTVIIYTSDHGEFMGFHHMILKGNHMYDPLVRVPLIVRYPGGQRAGEVSAQMVANIDLAPTMLRLAGLEPPETMRGLDLTDRTADRPFIFAESGRAQWYMVRSRHHKLLACRDPRRDLFYDLDTDPHELDNRAGSRGAAASVAAHREALYRWLAFEAPPIVYRDEAAPQTGADNVPARDDGHREAMLAYFEQAARPHLKENGG